MVIQNGSDIYITRGDEATIGCEVVCEDGTDYAPEEGDRLTLIISDEETGRAYLEREMGAEGFALTGAETEKLSGEYAYSVVLTYADGVRTTVIGKTPNKTPRLIMLG